MVCLLGYKYAMLAQVESFINGHPQILPLWAALKSFSTKSVFVVGIAPAQMQDFALGLIELHEVGLGRPLKPVHIPWNDIPSLLCVNCTTQLGVIES